MQLNAPTQMMFLISLVLAILGLVGSFVAIPFVSAYAFWFVLVGYAVLALGTVMKGM